MAPNVRIDKCLPKPSAGLYCKAMLSRRIILGFAASLVLSAGCGHVERQMSISSNPSGALVYLNGQEVGRTPCTVDFTWYGRYDLALRMDGFQTLKTTQYVPAPWWQWVPFDLGAEVLPGRKLDNHYYAFALQAQTGENVDAALLVDRAASLKPMLESGEFTRKPATRPTSPATAPSSVPSDH